MIQVESAEVLHQHEVGFSGTLFLQQKPPAVVRDRAGTVAQEEAFSQDAMNWSASLIGGSVVGLRRTPGLDSPRCCAYDLEVKRR